MRSSRLIRKYRNKVERVLRRLPPARWLATFPNPVLAEALGPWGAERQSDIRDHLGTIFFETLASRPQLIVELGTRSGVSTRALLAAAELADAHVLSVDCDDCSDIVLPERFRARWSFVQADDVTFADGGFVRFCAGRELPPRAELLLIDTSHEYEHTRSELKAWLPLLAPGGAALFHDTNMGGGWFRRLDGKVEPGPDNERGVMRALEELLGRRFDETTYFSDHCAGFAIRHVPWSSGFTVLRRLD